MVTQTISSTFLQVSTWPQYPALPQPSEMFPKQLLEIFLDLQRNICFRPQRNISKGCGEIFARVCREILVSAWGEIFVCLPASFSSTTGCLPAPLGLPLLPLLLNSTSSSSVRAKFLIAHKAFVKEAFQHLMIPCTAGHKDLPFVIFSCSNQKPSSGFLKESRLKKYFIQSA